MKRTFINKLTSLLGGALVFLLLLAVIGAVFQAISTFVDSRRYPAPGERVDVGGYYLHIYCIGENINSRPTVVLEHGLGGTTAAWVRIQAEIAKTTQVCSYDRAGMGLSDTGPDPRDAEHIGAELYRLLDNADVHGPYVLVGWSYGGHYVRMFASQHPDKVAGVVLLDAAHPDQWISTSASQSQFKRYSRMYAVTPLLARIGVPRLMGFFQPDSGLPAPQNGAVKASFAASKDWDAQSAEFLASPATNDQVRRLNTLNDIPLFVLSATDHGYPSDLEHISQELQNDLALLSTNSVHQTVIGANHTSFWLDPETSKISVAAILYIVDTASANLTAK